MIKYLAFSFFLSIIHLSAMDKLPSEYQVSFGDQDALIEITQYYSLSCPHCVQIFKNDFKHIQEEFIDTGKLRYIFHPVPMDLTTVQFLCCLEGLTNTKKQLLLSVLLEELSLENSNYNVILMKHAMDVLKSPLEKLDDEDYIKNSNGFKCASDFVTQNENLKTVPSIQIGDRVIEKIPDYEFISLIIDRLCNSEADYEH